MFAPKVRKPQTETTASSTGRFFPSHSKPTVGSVNDPLEHEADRAADAAMAMNGSAPLPSARSAGGQALAPQTRAFFERAYHHDFSRVRIHAGQEAAESAAALSARAYTAGSHIVLGGPPQGNAGRRTLAHELAHVVQQGGASPLPRFGVPPVSMKSSTPAIQRQPLKGGDWVPEKVKPLVKNADTTPGQEIWKVVEKNDLKGTPSLVRSATIDGAKHEWRITIKAKKEGTAGNPGPHGRTGDITQSTKAGVTIHTVPVTVNTILGSSAEEQKLYPTGQEAERVNFMAARTLYHEIMHALIAIDAELPAGEKRSQATKKYEDLRTRAANDPNVVPARDAVLSTISAMANNAESAAGVPDLFDPTVKTAYPTPAARLEGLAKSEGLDKIIGKEAIEKTAADTASPMNHPSGQRRMFLQDSITTLISEKNARTETGKAFSLPNYGSNKRTAEDYVKKIPETLQDLARLRSRNATLDVRSGAGWQNAEQTLQMQV